MVRLFLVPALVAAVCAGVPSLLSASMQTASPPAPPGLKPAGLLPDPPGRHGLISPLHLPGWPGRSPGPFGPPWPGRLLPAAGHTKASWLPCSAFALAASHIGIGAKDLPTGDDPGGPRILPRGHRRLSVSCSEGPR